MAGLIYTQMNKVMKEIGSIGKDQKNQSQGFSFRGIDQFVNSLHPALTKHGVFMTTEVLNYNSELKDVTRSNGKAGVDKHVKLVMKYTFHAEDGSSVTSTIPAEGLDSGDKATNKALSAALKYALIQTFSVPTEDIVDGDADSPTIGHTAAPAITTATTTLAIAPNGITAINATPSSTTTTEAPAKKFSSFRKVGGAKAATPSNTEMDI